MFSLKTRKWDASWQATIQMLELCRFFGNAARPIPASLHQRNSSSLVKPRVDGIFVIFAEMLTQFGLHDTITRHIFSIRNGASGVIMCASSQWGAHELWGDHGPWWPSCKCRGGASINLTWSKKTCHTSYIMPVGLVCFIIVAIVNAMLVIRYFRSQW